MNHVVRNIPPPVVLCFCLAYLWLLVVRKHVRCDLKYVEQFLEIRTSYLFKVWYKHKHISPFSTLELYGLKG